MTEHPDLEEIRNLPEVELLELLQAIAPEKLAALRDAEAADATPRTDVLEAIDAALAAPPKSGQRTDTETAAATAPKPLTKAQRQAAERAAAEQRKRDNLPATVTASDAPAKVDAPPAWQAENYDGPITIPQAEWRRANIKPVREARTK